MTFARAAEDFKSFLSDNVVGGCDVTDEGVLDISYSAGIVFDVTNDENQSIVASPADITLTDDDTNYLYWTTGTALAVKLTVPTGNEVLVATIVTAIGDITSITPAGIDPANLTNISIRPVVRLADDKHPTFYTVATVIIKQENLAGFENSFAIRKEEYRLLVDVSVNNSENGSIGLKDLIAEIDSKNRANNKLQTREYFYDLSYAWRATFVKGLLALVVTCKRRQGL